MTFSRIFFACGVSLALYITAFAMVLDRPLSLGFLRQEIDASLARGMSIAGPKLVVLAGSNGQYSHRCATIEPIVNMPCVNGGIAVGIGVDYLFTRWKRLLHAGDTVYLPMEEAQYGRGRAETAVGPDAAIMLRHDRRTLAELTPDRWVGALFATNLRNAMMAPIEMALVAVGFHDPRSEVTGSTNAWGDHTGHTIALAAASIPVLAVARPYHLDVAQIRDGYGTRIIIGFIGWAQEHRVRVIGGLPTGFIDSPLPHESVAMIRSIYTTHGAAFLELPNHSLYGRTAFFDTAQHLNETWQIIHSISVAEAIGVLLRDSAVTDHSTTEPTGALGR